LTAQNAQFWTAILVIGIQCASDQIGGYSRTLVPESDDVR
jgi:hypothetical protein